MPWAQQGGMWRALWRGRAHLGSRARAIHAGWLQCRVPPQAATGPRPPKRIRLVYLFAT